MPDACILLVDLSGFTGVTESAPTATIERILTTLESLTTAAALQFAGTIRYSIGDGYCITFDTATNGVAAAERLGLDWDAANRRDRFGCAINLVLHRGYICGFRSFLYGKGLTEAARVQRASRQLLTDEEGGVLLTEVIRRDLADSRWQSRVLPVTLGLPDLVVYRLSVAEVVIPPPAAPQRVP